VYAWVIRQAVVPLLEAFDPDFVCTQLGVDTHYQDPLTHMACTTRGYMAAVNEIAQCARRWVAFGGGGYDITVVPRAWTLAFARMAGAEAPDTIPASEVESYSNSEKVVPIHDAGGPAIDDDWARITREYAAESVAEVRARIFPVHGLNGGA
jgi:acetoin utilization protein AcuC